MTKVGSSLLSVFYSLDVKIIIIINTIEIIKKKKLNGSLKRINPLRWTINSLAGDPPPEYAPGMNEGMSVQHVEDLVNLNRACYEKFVYQK